MRERLERLYRTGRLTDAGLARAVSLGWLTEAQAADIRAGITAK